MAERIRNVAIITKFNSIEAERAASKITELLITKQIKVSGWSIVSNFDISVGNNNAYKITIPFDQLMLYYFTPAMAGIERILMYIMYSLGKVSE